MENKSNMRRISDETIEANYLVDLKDFENWLTYQRIEKLATKERIKNFGEQKQKVLILDINDSTEEQKNKLRGAIKYFCGDKNNINVQIKIDKVDGQIKEKERLEKQASSPSERLEISKEIQKLRLRHRELRQEQFLLEDSRNEDIDQKLKLVEQALDGEPRMCELFTIAWSIV